MVRAVPSPSPMELGMGLGTASDGDGERNPRADLIARATGPTGAGEGKRARVGGSEWAATARAVRSALLRDQHPCIHAPRDISTRPSVGRGKPPTRGACAVVSSAAHERKGMGLGTAGDGVGDGDGDGDGGVAHQLQSAL